MPSWGEVLAEVNDLVRQRGSQALDLVRRKYLLEAHRLTGRAIILYASNWMSADPSSFSLTTVMEEDLQGFMVAVQGLKGDQLDLVVHSPGGSVEAVQAIVSYLREKFNHIRVIVPHMAKSAATMLACAADEIVMGKHSFLGPVDPQFVLQTGVGIRMVPAQAILDQFDMALEQCQDPVKLGAWLPMLQSYGPSLLVECKNTLDLGKKLVASWLSKYMLRNKDNARKISEGISGKLSDHNYFKSHGYSLSRTEARELGLKITDLEADQQQQDVFLSVFHASTITFDSSLVVKIIENHLGRAYLKLPSVTMTPAEIPPAQPGQKEIPFPTD